MVANAVASLTEISETSPTAAAVNELDSATVNKLLTALNECTELVILRVTLSILETCYRWGQVFILDALSSYTPPAEREAQR